MDASILEKIDFSENEDYYEKLVYKIDKDPIKSIPRLSIPIIKKIIDAKNNNLKNEFAAIKISVTECEKIIEIFKNKSYKKNKKDANSKDHLPALHLLIDFVKNI